MTIAYFDCFSGISGDMTLGALVDLGVPVAWLKEQLTQLPLSGFDIQSQKVSRNGIAATQVKVIAPETHHHRDYGHIRDLIQKAGLADTVKADCLAVFERLATAEAKIHGCELEHVHFHEVGGIDAIVDIVGSCLAKAHLGIDTIIASPLPLGHGFVNCAHGLLPVPAPAVLEILKGVPVYSGPQEKELVTPTGASLLAALAQRFETLPMMRIEGIGYGAGTHELKDQPNALRVILGTRAVDHSADVSGGSREKLVMVESCVDDMNPEIYGFLMERLFAEGALDVYWVPIQMKKNRPGTLIKVLCSPERQSAVTSRILAETTSLGVRSYEVQRVSLAREIVEVATSFGPVTAKKVIEKDGTCRIVPEFDICKQIALDRGLPLRKVYDIIVSAVSATHGSVLLDKQRLDKSHGRL